MAKPPKTRAVETDAIASEAAAQPSYGALQGLLGYQLRRAQLRVYDDFLRTLAQWQMTPPRYAALEIVAENAQLKLTDLANMLGIARSGAVLLVDTLVEMGYMERLPSLTDKRAFALKMTTAGQATLKAIRTAVQAHEAHITAQLSPAERAKLLQLIERVG